MGDFSQKRFALVVLTACLALSAVLAEAFVFTRLDHDCTGDHCPVCLQVEIAKNLLEGLGRAGIIALIAFFTYTKKTVKVLSFFYTFLTKPVLLKVKYLS